jgi:hypothetical protein
MSSNGTYGTARVLFQDAATAKAAIEWEVSTGYIGEGRC